MEQEVGMKLEMWRDGAAVVEVRIMTVDRSRGADRQALSSTTNRIKRDGIPPGGLDTHQREIEAATSLPRLAIHPQDWV